MSGSFYYTTFSFKATGLSQILSEFKSVAAQIDAQAASIGKLNFTGMNAALPVLKNIDNTLLLMAEHANLLSSSGAKLGNVFTPMSAGATKASTATKSVATSMTQLQAVSGQVSSATTKATSSMSALGAAGKAALGGVISSGERAIATMSGLSAAMMSVGRSAARMGTLAAIPMAGMRGLSGAVTGSLLASSAAMLLNPFNAAPLAAGYGAYTGMNIEKWASEAAAKSWKPGMSKADSDLIKQYVQQLARSQVGTSVYSPTDLSQAIAEYAGMGGNVTPGTTNALNESMLKGFSQYAQAINAESIGNALNTLISQSLTWNGLEGAFTEKNLKYTENLMASLVATTKAKDSDLAPLLKDVSSVAKTYGRSQTETYAMTASLYQLGLQPQQAGMAYRRILLRGTPNVNDLQKQEAYDLGITNEKGQIIDPETGKAIGLSNVNKALNELGVTWKDINPETYGEMGSLGVINKITEEFKKKGYSDLDKQAWIKTVYGLQGTTPFAMLEQNPDLAKEYFKIFSDSQKGLGASAEMSAIQVDNLEGSLKFLKTSLQGTAAGISDYVNPSLRKFADFLRESAIPQLNNLGSALASGDWEGVADIVGSSLDFLGEKFLNSDETLTSWINNGIDGLDEFSQRFLDFTSGGGVGDLFSNLGQWAQNIWDGIDWSQVGDITSNLSTAFNAAWDQSVEWLRTSLENVDWSELGTRAGEALEGAGLWILNKIGDLPWSELTTAATNALTGIVLNIDWVSAVSTIMRIGDDIGAALYNGVASSNLGILFQNWAIEFQNSMGMAIASIAGHLAALMAQVGFSVATIQGAADTVIGTGEGIVKNLKQTNFEDIYKWGVYDLTHSTNTQGEYTGKGDFLYLNNGTLTLKNPFETVPAGSNAQSLVLAGTKNQQKVSEKFGVDIDTARAIEPYANLRADNSLYGVTFGISGNTYGPIGMDEGVSASEALNQFKQDLPAIEWMQNSIMKAKTPTKAYVDGIYTCANFVDDTIKEIQLAEDSDLENAIKSGNSREVEQQKLEQQWSHQLGMATVPYSSDMRHAQLAMTASGGMSAEDISLFEVTNGNDLGYKGQVRSVKDLPYPNQDFVDFLKDYYMVGTQPKAGNNQSSIKEFITKKTGLEFGLQPGQTLGSVSDVKIAGVGGTEEKSYPGIERSPRVGQDVVDATYKAASGNADSIKISDKDHSENHKKSSSSSSSSSETSSDETSSARSLINTESILQGWLSYWNDPKNKFKYEGSALETFLNNPEKSLGSSINPSTIKSVQVTDEQISAISQQTSITDKQTSSISQQTSVTDKQTSATGQQTSATDQLTSATSSLTGEFAAFADLINSGDYEGISKLLKEKYAYDNPLTPKTDERENIWSAETLKNIDTYTEDKSDIDSALLSYIKFLKATQGLYPSNNATESLEETAKNTKKIAGFSDPMAVFKTITDAFSGSVISSNNGVSDAVQTGFEKTLDQGTANQALQKNLYSTICDIEGFLTPESVSPLGTFTSPQGGNLVRVGDTWMTKEEYEATMGISLSEQQMNAAATVGKVPFYGTITPEDIPGILADYETRSPWSQENIKQALKKYQSMYEYDLGLPDEWGVASKPYNTVIGGQSRKPDIASVLLGSLADNDVMEIPVDPVVNTEPIDSFKAGLGEGTSFKVDVSAPNANAVSGQLQGLGGWTTFTVYIDTVSRNYANNLTGVNYGDKIPGLPNLLGTPNMDLDDIPAFAEGGYTGDYEGGATVHPHELILNEAQQRNVASAMGSSGKSVSINIDARGAIIAGDGMDVLVEKIKNAMQDEMYR